MADPARWFLKFDTAGGGGRPWGDGTAMAKRATAGTDPWDEACIVEPIIGGYAAMKAIRDALEQTITAAKAGGAPPPGQRGHVYISGWRFNPQRELGDTFTPWGPTTPALDQTAIGFVLRLMQAGVIVRIMVWLPALIETPGSGDNHVEEHRYLARVVAAEETRLAKPTELGVAGLGMVALDARTAQGSIAGSHHQKAIVIRGLGTNHVAFCGGVDLAFTRRDAPAAGTPLPLAGVGFLAGDWQSGTEMPAWTPPPPWPRDNGVTVYTSTLGQIIPKSARASDLPGTDGFGNDIYGDTRQIWHDQHLVLRGPIVQTLEDQFAERWKDTGKRAFDLSNDAAVFGDQVIFSSPAALNAGAIVPLPNSVAAPAVGGASAVQMWRTIPWRDARTGPPFERAEFTVLSGVNHAIQQANELIWIFDQYFWSVPLARELDAQLTAKPGLHVIVILPPYADSQPAIIHEARRRALDALTENNASRVAVYGLWDPRGSARGIYCHAKVQIFDGGLLVVGSANMNRRSFLCDSELACAVADEVLVGDHQRALWDLLFQDTATPAWPAAVSDLDQAGSGATFFAAFTAAANDLDAYLALDPWKDAAPRLLNFVALPRGQFGQDVAIDRIFDPTSVDPDVLEGDVEFRDGGVLKSRPVRLSDVVRRLEETTNRGGRRRMPNRRQSSEFRLPLFEFADPRFSDFAL